MLSQNSEKYLGNLLLVGLTLVTVTVYSAGVTDPVNVPKLFILGGVALSAMAVFSFRNWKDLVIQNPLVTFLLLLFLAASLNSLFNSEAPITQSLYGVYGRNNGFLMYFFLSILLTVTLALKREKSFQSIINALYLSGLINVIYCLWVVFFGDFIGWANPYGNILGTLGNPNFIGSFFGMYSSILFTKLFSANNSRKSLIVNLLTIVATLFLIYKSHAIQGRVLFVAALCINLFYYLRSKFASNFPSLLVMGGSIILGAIGALGTLQKGPLTGLLYKDSVSLRGQYWYSGIQMGKEHLLSGVGFDSYGDWYRSVRRASALIRPGVEVTSNTAHNVVIDLFAFGGVPLLFSYLAILFLVLVSIFRLTRARRDFDPIFVSLVGVWLCYVLQSIISINQIGLAIWGWSIAGAIFGYSNYQVTKSRESLDKSKAEKVKRNKAVEIFSPGLRGGVGLLVGLLISIPPLSGDMKWRTAQLSGNASQVEQALKPSYMNPQNSFRYVSTVGVLIDSQLPDLALRYARDAIKFNPRSYESWRLYIFLSNATMEQKKLALRKMKILDPLNPSIPESAQ